MPVRKVFVSQDDEDEEWNTPKPDEIQPGLQFVDNDFTKREIVKLRFEADGKLSYGSGFYMKIPAASCDVILTTGHNLVAENGIRTTQLAIASGEARKFQPVRERDIRVCAKYLEERKSMFDYGAILVRHATLTSKSHGYGYSMTLAFGTSETFENNNVSVIGYQDSSKPGRPRTSTGEGRKLKLYATSNQVKYPVATEKGMSGSAVTVEYEGKQTILAIHTRRPGNPGSRSRGILLTPAVLREIYSWVGAGEFNTGLKVKDTRSAAGRSENRSNGGLPKDGLFVVFPSGWNFARICVGIENASKFDVIPAKAATGSNSEYHAIAYGDKWVSFNTRKAGGTLELVTVLNSSCLFEKGDVKGKEKAVRIVVTNAAGKSMQVMASIEGFTSMVAGAMSSGLYMVEYPHYDNELFTEFWFES